MIHLFSFVFLLFSLADREFMKLSKKTVVFVNSLLFSVKIDQHENLFDLCKKQKAKSKKQISKYKNGMWNGKSKFKWIARIV